ncbi:MAG: hypothetical protein FIA97_01880 [Methylococcaceae bacterium]|nr:hypothetical protein [Methylococcaceae bacterium]
MALLLAGLGGNVQARPQYFTDISNTCTGAAKTTAVSTGCPLCHVGATRTGGGASGGNASGPMVGPWLSGGATAVCAALTPKGPVDAHAPTLSFDPTGNKRFVHVNETLTFKVVGHDADGDPVSVAATSLPATASFTGGESGTGEFSWTPTSAGTAEPVFQATDSPANGADPKSSPRRKITIAVDDNQPPQLDSLVTPMIVPAGKVVKLDISASDPDSDRLKFGFGKDTAGKTIKPAGSALKPQPRDQNKSKALFVWKPKPALAGKSVTVDFTVTDLVPNPYQDDRLVEIQVNPGLKIGTSKYVGETLKVKGKVLASPDYLQQGVKVKLIDQATSAEIATVDVGAGGLWSHVATGPATGAKTCTIQAVVQANGVDLTNVESPVTGCR